MPNPRQWPESGARGRYLPPEPAAGEGPCIKDEPGATQDLIATHRQVSEMEAGPCIEASAGLRGSVCTVQRLALVLNVMHSSFGLTAMALRLTP